MGAEKFQAHPLQTRDREAAPASIKPEPENSGSWRVVKSNEPAVPTVRSYQFSKLGDGKIPYEEVKSRFGSLAITDEERLHRTRQDSRFQLTPLQRDPLSVEEEERRVIDQRVKDRVEGLAEEARKKAVGQGYQDGLKKGYVEAFNKFQKDGLQRLEKLGVFLKEFEGAKDQIFRANERFLVEMVYRLSRMVMLKELSADREYVQRLARDLIDRMGVRENITVKVSEEMAETIGMLKESLEKSVGNLKNLNIQVSDQVKAGGCIVETEWNAIDANLDTQFRGVYNALVGQESGDRDKLGN